jgi:hypothetical protein
METYSCFQLEGAEKRKEEGEEEESEEEELSDRFG